MTGRQPSWSRLPSLVRTLGWWATVVQLVGYTTSLVYVWWTTRLLPSGVAEHYRGADPAGGEGQMTFAKSFAEMLTITHTHLLSMAVIFVMSGISVAMVETVPLRWRRVLVVEPFAALLVSFMAMWLMRYVHPAFSLLLELSSGLMAITFYVQCGLVLRDLWRLRAAP
jgi:hypothetical protein